MQEKNLGIYLKELERECEALLSPFIINSFSSNSLLEFKKSSSNYRDNLSYINDEDEIEYFPPFYNDGKLYHFYQTDALITFLWCGYEIENFRLSDESLYAKLSYANERIHLFTMPDSFVLAVKIENIKNNEMNIKEIIVDGFSSIAFYRLTRDERFRILKLPEINSIFINHLKKFLNYIINSLYSENYKTYIL